MPSFRKKTMEELGRPSADAFRQMPRRDVVLVLDNIRSGLNVGSIFRTADAFAARQIHLCGITARPPHREILKSALGATETVPWQGHDEVADCLEQLKAEGCFIAGIEQTHDSTPLHRFAPPAGRPLALVLGNEVRGISEAALPWLDVAVEIPQFGAKHSINVAVCAGIVLWHLVEKAGPEHWLPR